MKLLTPNETQNTWWNCYYDIIILEMFISIIANYTTASSSPPIWLDK